MSTDGQSGLSSTNPTATVSSHRLRGEPMPSAPEFSDTPKYPWLRRVSSPTGGPLSYKKSNINAAAAASCSPLARLSSGGKQSGANDSNHREREGGGVGQRWRKSAIAQSVLTAPQRQQQQQQMFLSASDVVRGGNRSDAPRAATHRNTIVGSNNNINNTMNTCYGDDNPYLTPTQIRLASSSAASNVSNNSSNSCYRVVGAADEGDGSAISQASGRGQAVVKDGPRKDDHSRDRSNSLSQSAGNKQHRPRSPAPCNTSIQYNARQPSPHGYIVGRRSINEGDLSYAVSTPPQTDTSSFRSDMSTTVATTPRSFSLPPEGDSYSTPSRTYTGTLLDSVKYRPLSYHEHRDRDPTQQLSLQLGGATRRLSGSEATRRNLNMTPIHELTPSRCAPPPPQIFGHDSNHTKLWDPSRTVLSSSHTPPKANTYSSMSTHLHSSHPATVGSIAPTITDGFSPHGNDNKHNREYSRYPNSSIQTTFENHSHPYGTAETGNPHNTTPETYLNLGRTDVSVSLFGDRIHKAQSGNNSRWPPIRPCVGETTPLLKSTRSKQRAGKERQRSTQRTVHVDPLTGERLVTVTMTEESEEEIESFSNLLLNEENGAQRTVYDAANLVPCDTRPKGEAALNTVLFAVPPHNILPQVDNSDENNNASLLHRRRSSVRNDLQKDLVEDFVAVRTVKKVTKTTATRTIEDEHGVTIGEEVISSERTVDVKQEIVEDIPPSLIEKLPDVCPVVMRSDCEETCTPKFERRSHSSQLHTSPDGGYGDDDDVPSSIDMQNNMTKPLQINPAIPQPKQEDLSLMKSATSSAASPKDDKKANENDNSGHRECPHSKMNRVDQGVIVVTPPSSASTAHRDVTSFSSPLSAASPRPQSPSRRIEIDLCNGGAYIWISTRPGYAAATAGMGQYRREERLRDPAEADRYEEDSDHHSEAVDSREGTKGVHDNAAMASPDHALEPFVMPLGSPRPNTSFNRLEAIEKAKVKAFSQLTSPSRVPAESLLSYEREEERHSCVSRAPSEKKNRLDPSPPRKEEQATEIKHGDTRQRFNQDQHGVSSINRSTHDENENEQQINGRVANGIINSILKGNKNDRLSAMVVHDDEEPEKSTEKCEESQTRKELSSAMLRRIRQQARSARGRRHRKHGDHSSGGSFSSSSTSSSLLSSSTTTSSSSAIANGTATATKSHPITRTMDANKKAMPTSPPESIGDPRPTDKKEAEKDKKREKDHRAAANDAHHNRNHNNYSNTNDEMKEDEDDIFSQLSPLSPSLTIPKTTVTQNKTKKLKAKTKPSLLNLHEGENVTNRIEKNKKSLRDPHRSSSARSSVNDDDNGRPRWSWSTHPDNNTNRNNSKTRRTPTSTSKANVHSNMPPQIGVPVESTIVCGRCSSRRQLHEKQPLLPELIAALKDLRPELLPPSAAVVPVYPIPPTAPSAFPQHERTVHVGSQTKQQREDRVERERSVDSPRSLSRSRSPSPSLADVATIAHLARCSARGLAKHLSVDEATAQALSTALDRAAKSALSSRTATNINNNNNNGAHGSSVFQNTVDHSFGRSASALSTLSASTTASRRNTPALPIAASVSPTTNHSVIADRTYYVLPVPAEAKTSWTPNSDQPRRSLSGGVDAAKEEEQRRSLNRNALTSDASHQQPVVAHQHHYYYAIPPPAIPALSPMLSVFPHSHSPSFVSTGAPPEMLARSSLSRSEATDTNTYNKQKNGTEDNHGGSDENAFWLTREGNDSEHHSRISRHTNSHNTPRSPSKSMMAYPKQKEAQKGAQPEPDNTFNSSNRNAQEKGRSRSVGSVESLPRRSFSFASITSGPSRSSQEALSRRCHYRSEPTETEKERYRIARRKLKEQEEEERQQLAAVGGLADYSNEKKRGTSGTPSQFLFVDNSKETRERVLRERREANAKGNAFIHSAALSNTANNNDITKASSADSPFRGIIEGADVAINDGENPQSNSGMSRATPNSRRHAVSYVDSTLLDNDKNANTNTILGYEDSEDNDEKRKKDVAPQLTNNNNLETTKNQNPPPTKRSRKNNTFSYESSDGSEYLDDRCHRSSPCRHPSGPRPCSGSSREPSPKPRTGCDLLPTSPPRSRPSPQKGTAEPQARLL